MVYSNDLWVQASMVAYEQEVNRHLLQAEARRSARSTAGPVDASRHFPRPFAALRHLVPSMARRRSISHTAETR